MGLFGGSFAVWPTGNSIDFKICLREKASGQKGGELDGGRYGWREKSGNFSEGDDRCTPQRGAEDGGRECAASKMCRPFLRHKPVVSDDNNEDAAQWRSRSSRLLCAPFHVHEIVPFFVLRSISQYSLYLGKVNSSMLYSTLLISTRHINKTSVGVTFKKATRI